MNLHRFVSCPPWKDPRLGMPAESKRIFCKLNEINEDLDQDLIKNLSKVMSTMRNRVSSQAYFLTRIDVAQDFVGSFYMQDPQAPFELLSAAKFWSVTPQQSHDIEDTSTCLSLIWHADGIDPRDSKKNVMFKRITIYSKGNQFIERSPKGGPIDSFLRGFFASGSKLASKLTREDVQKNGMFRIECKYYFYSTLQESRFVHLPDNALNINQLVEGLKDHFRHIVN